MNVIICSVEKSKFNIIKVKVLEQGKRFYQIVSKRDKKYGIHNWLFEIERSGGKGDKETSYEIYDEYELSDKEREKLMAVKIYDLEEFYAELAGDNDNKHHKPVKSSKAEEPEEDDDDLIINEEELNELVSMLKTLKDPEAASIKFCEEFGIKRVKFLRKSQFRKAFKYVDRLTAPEHPDSDDEDVSPF